MPRLYGGDGVPRNVYDNAEAPFSAFADVPVAVGPEVGLQRSTHLAPTPLSEKFFSRANVDALQRALRDVIRRRMGYAIDRQSDQQLMIVMRYVFMQRARHEGGDAEVRRLNDEVLREIAPQVASGVEQYIGYLRDASTLPTPMARGQATSIKGTTTGSLFRPVAYN